MDKKYTFLPQRFLPLLAMLVITAQLAAHVLGPRVIVVGNLILPGGIWSFPLTFFLWDVITEVYGFKNARRILYYYVICQILFALLIYFSLQGKGDPEVSNIGAFSDVLSLIPKITFAMIIAIFLGDYVNCFILQRLKVYTSGKHLWFRLIGATAIGEAVASSLWVLIFYWHTKIHPDIFKLIFSQYIVKIGYEIICVPPTYLVVYLLKKYDLKQPNSRYLNFNPNTI